MTSTLKRDARLEEDVHVCSGLGGASELRPEAIFAAAQMLVIDDYPWRADLSVIRRGLIPAPRVFKAPFGGDRVSAEVGAQLAVLGEDVETMRSALYPRVEVGAREDIFRPMVSGPEPLHFDTFEEATPWISCFVNVAASPRVYGVSHSFPALVRDSPDEMRAVVIECRGKLQDLSYRIRLRTQRNAPPLNSSSPRHVLELAPGAVWFFNAKTVSHELRYGEGAMSFGWPVRGNVARQAELVGGL